MKRISTTALAAVALLPSTALALDLGNGFSVVGEVQLDYLSDGDDDATLSFADVTLGWRSETGGGIGFGFDLTVQNAELRDEDVGDTILWAAGVVTTRFGEIAIGRPQPVLERMFKVPNAGGTRFLDLQFSTFGGVGGSFLSQLAVLEDVDFLGVTLKGQSGGLTYAVGAHNIDSGTSDVNAFEGGLLYSMGGTELFAGFERLDTPGAALDRIQVGARYRAERWSVGVHHSELDFLTTNFGATSVFADFDVTEAITLAAAAHRLDLGSDSATFYGVSGEYSFGPGGFATLGYLKADELSEDIVSVSLGYRF